jgi:hypothetical protein
MRQFSLSAAAAVDMAERTAIPTRKNNAASLMRLNAVNSESLPFYGILLNKASLSQYL